MDKCVLCKKMKEIVAVYPTRCKECNNYYKESRKPMKNEETERYDKMFEPKQ